jgi:gluconolactonase
VKRPARALAALLALAAPAARAAAPPVPDGAPAAVIDLGTPEGVALVQGEWRHSEARIVELAHRRPDAAGQPTGAPVQTWGIEPRAGGPGFDDSAWERVAPGDLAGRRGRGRLCFNWYRIRITVPERVGDVDPTGATLVFETVVDDYAEIWVDGEIPRGLGQRGGSVVAGWNAPNRIAIGRNVRPGQQIQLAIFGANGPLSDPPANFIYLRGAKLELHRETARGPWALEPHEVNVEVERLDPELDAIVPANPKLFKLAEGLQFGEGPLWLRAAGVLLFSDPNANRIYRYDPRGSGTLAVYREQSGYAGADVAEYGQPGSNGLTLDRAGRLVAAEHGRHRISRSDDGGAPVALVDAFEGRRLNSPNDLVFRSDGTLYFSDPPFGLPKLFDDPRKQLPFSGVFAWTEAGGLRLVAQDLAGPNGLAFSPDERFLYVTNWDPQRKLVMRYPARPDGSLGAGEVFFDMTGAPGEEALDGIKVARTGHLFVSGPGGLWVLAPDGRHLGTIRGPRLPANFAWGGDDGKSLYLTARSALYRLPLLVEGVRP